MVCNECGGSCEFSHVSEDYVVHGKCRNCYVGYRLYASTKKRSIIKDFANLRVHHNDEQFRLLLRNGVYPYEYMSSWDKLEETKPPTKKAFHSNLHMSDSSDRDYEHAQKNWKEFGLKNFGEYHDFYLKTDVLLLSNEPDVFRITCLKHYKLDTAHF